MPKIINNILFKGAKTIIGFTESYQPKDAKQVATEITPGKEFDLPRHADFYNAMQALKPHVLFIPNLIRYFDENGNYVQPSFFKERFADKDAQFENIEVIGINMRGKNAIDEVQIIAVKTSKSGDEMPLKTPFIPLEKVESGYYYEFINILDDQLDFLQNEAEKFRTRTKHGAGVQQDLPLNQPHTNTVNQKNDKDLVTAE